jgi:hypothetical protein
VRTCATAECSTEMNCVMRQQTRCFTPNCGIVPVCMQKTDD